MNWRAIKAVIRKDLVVVLRSKAVLLPLILVPVIVLVVMPAVFGLIATAPLSADDMAELEAMLPPEMEGAFSGMGGPQLWVTFALTYMMAPMYLIIPLMVASVIAADSFVGERERKTLEALLHTPITNWELLVAKLLSGWLAAMGVALGSFVLYAIVANLVGYSVMGRLFFPNLMWVVMVLWVMPATAGLGLTAMVLVSIRVNTFQEAYQMGGVVVLPIVALMISQATGVMYFSVGLVLLLGLGLWVIDAVLLWFGVKTFRRSELMARL
jgi:ABC-2 type transport system permease protein